MSPSRIARNLAICLAAALILAGCMSSQVSFKRHPNLAEAQGFIQDAINKISAAQGANEFDMGGHAARAKALLSQAYDEVKLAALAANSK
jgi:hypothetical protein